MINEIKRKILDRLQPFKSRARIIADDTEGQAGSVSQVRSDFTIRVSYTGSNYSQPDNNDDVAFQFGNAGFQITLEIKDLRNEDKATKLVDEITDLFIGYCPCLLETLGEFSLQNDRFQQNREGIYFYVINISIPVRKLKNYGN